MAVLLWGLLIGAAMVAVIAAAGARAIGLLAAGLALMVLSAGFVALLPAHQTLCLPLAAPGARAAPAELLLWLVWICGGLGGGAVGWAIAAMKAAAPVDQHLRDGKIVEPSRVLPEIGIVALCTACALLGAAAGQISLARALLLGVCIGVALVIGLELRRSLANDLPELRSSWGGLGGGLGGWELSRPAVLLLVLLLLAGSALAAALGPPPPEAAPPDPWTRVAGC